MSILKRKEDEKAYVVINEQHSLFPEQIELLNQAYTKDGWNYLRVPSEGWTMEEIEEKAYEYKYCYLVFASPIPLLMRWSTGWKVFHNDHREKKELPNGRIISVVSATGWDLV